MELPGFSSFDFGAKGYRHKVYKKGDDSGPGILLIQELPGIQPETIRFAERLHNDGYTVYMPHLLGHRHTRHEGWCNQQTLWSRHVPRVRQPVHSQYCRRPVEYHRICVSVSLSHAEL